jgi:hypothetical protein
MQESITDVLTTPSFIWYFVMFKVSYKTGPHVTQGAELCLPPAHFPVVSFSSLFRRSWLKQLNKPN